MALFKNFAVAVAASLPYSIPFPRLLCSSSQYEASLPEEYDDHVRDVEICLYVSPVMSSSSSNAHPVDAPILGASLQTFTHWILVFKFRDGSVRAIQGINENETLLPSFMKVRDEGWTEVKLIGNRKMSPNKVRSLAASNNLNGSFYTLAGANCHSWVNVVLEELNLNSIPHTIDNEIKWKTRALMAGVFIHPIAGLAVLGWQQVHNAFK